jgi:hypothetical protein
LSGHSTSTCRCVRPSTAPPMLPTKRTTERTVADSACRALQAATKGTKKARHMLLPKTTLQWPESQHEQARTKPTVATDAATHQQARVTEWQGPVGCADPELWGTKSTHMGSATAQQTRPASAATTCTTSSTPAPPALPDGCHCCCS